MLKNKTFGVALCLYSAIAIAQVPVSQNLTAQQSLNNNLSAVNSAVTQQKQQEADAQEAREEQYRQYQLAKQRAAEQQAKLAAAQKAKKQAREQAEQDRIVAEQVKQEEMQRAQVAKDAAYQEQLRALAIKNRELDLQTKELEVKRTNDKIDQNLKRETAETDLIQSRADATRNISRGAGTLLNDTGAAKIKKASGWPWVFIVGLICLAGIIGLFIVKLSKSALSSSRKDPSPRIDPPAI
ncbi:MAG: hypothetical protein EPN41_11770 [Candidimonas sp.]|nr:MAG: hypothetical protein EPN41_11770 [Candidimonas sp.]